MPEQVNRSSHRLLKQVMNYTGAMSTAATEDFTPDELETWSSLSTLLEWLPAALDAQMQRDAGLSHFEFGVLFALSKSAEGQVRLSELAGYANSTLSRLSRAITRLEKKGYAHRSPDPSDGRFTLAILSPQGRAVIDQATPGHVALVRALVFDSLSAAQAKQLGASSRRITQAINAEGAWAPTP